MTDTPPPPYRTKFERFVERHLDSVVFLVVILGVSQLLGQIAVATWPGLLTAEVWVQIGYGLLIGLFTAIVAVICASLARDWARCWTSGRYVRRQCDWLAEQWDVDR